MKKETMTIKLKKPKIRNSQLMNMWQSGMLRTKVIPNKKKKMIPFPHINHRKELSESSGLLVFHNTYIKEAIDKEKMDKLWEKAYIGDSKVDLVQIRNPSLNMRSSSSKKKKLVFKTNNIKDLNLYREFENILYKYK